MRISVKKGSLAQTKADVLVVGVHSGTRKLEGATAALDKRMRGALATAMSFGDFSGDGGEATWVAGNYTQAKRVLLVGLGKSKGYGLDSVRQACAVAASCCMGAKLRNVALEFNTSSPLDPAGFACAAAEGFDMAGYNDGLHITESKAKRPSAVSRLQILTDDADAVDALRAGADRGQAMAAGVNFSRDLVNQPSNVLTPTAMANEAKAMAKEFATLSCTVWGPKDIEKNAMGGIIGVGRGSAEPSQFIQLEYKPEGAKKNLKTIAFVGKGLTFDTGGISIKPAAGMELMKFDMGGAAAVLGAFRILAETQPNVRVLGYVAAAENMPDGLAIKPGDLLTMMSGLTVEVNNTDAEGRLVLADAIHYAKLQKPAFIVDAATLTGACMIALGEVACGVMSEDDDLVELIQAASKASGDAVWRLPLGEEHRKLMKGHVADLKNTGPREGGASTAAGFLSRFAKGARWAHLDIAGTVWTDSAKPINPKGATGFGARLFAAIAEEAAE